MSHVPPTVNLSVLLFVSMFRLLWGHPAYAQVSTIRGPNDPSMGSLSASPRTVIDSEEPLQIAQQSPTVETQPDLPGRINYLGIGGAVGLSDEGETSLGEGGFAVVGRTSLTNTLSIHTASVFGDNGTFSAALTGGVPIINETTGRTQFFPFLGAGILIETEEFENVDPLATAGMDVPLSNRVTGTARINASFADQGTDVGLVLGVGIDVFSLIF